MRAGAASVTSRNSSASQGVTRSVPTLSTRPRSLAARSRRARSRVSSSGLDKKKAE